jgi:hypothetical protein
LNKQLAQYSSLTYINHMSSGMVSRKVEIEKMETYGEVYQEFKPTDVTKAGRVFGYIFAVRDVMVDGVVTGVATWVQRGVQTKFGFDEFGTKNSATYRVADAKAARAIANRKISERIEANRASWQRNGHKVI